MSQQKSVKGLANIGALLDRGVPLQIEQPKSDKRHSREAIAAKTLNSLKHFSGHGTATQAKAVDLHNRGVIEAAVREAYNLGHADALEQNNAVEALLDKQYKARTDLTLPAAVAGIMEQNGMSSMMLDMAALSTVFDRTRIEFEPTLGAAGEFIEYRLIFLADDKEKANG